MRLLYGFVLGVFFLSSFAEAKPDLWDDVLLVVKQVREFVEHGVAADDPRLKRLKRKIEGLAEDADGIRDFQKHLYGDGALESDDFLKNLDFIAVRTTGAAADGVARRFVLDLGFDALSRALAGPPEAPAGALRAMSFGGGFEAAGLESVQSDAPPAEESLHQSAESRLGRFEASMQDLLAARQNFAAAAKKAESKVYKLHSALVLVGMIGSAAIAGRFYDLTRLSPREAVSLVAGFWGLHYATHYLYWILGGRLKARQEASTVDEKKELDEISNLLLDLFPEFAGPQLTAAAEAKPLSLDSAVGVHEDQSLGVYMARKDDPNATEVLMGLALNSLKHGLTKRAIEILKEVESREPETSRGKKARATVAAIETKNRIEWKVTKSKAWSVAKKTGLMVLGLVGLDQAVVHTLHESVAAWRAFAVAASTAFATPKQIWKWLWKNPPRAKLEKTIGDDGEVLHRNFMEILAVDPTGETIAAMAMHNTSEGAQPCVFNAALRALATAPSGEVTKTLLRWLRHEMATTSGPSERIRALMETAVGHYKSCLHQITQKVSAN